MSSSSWSQQQQQRKRKLSQSLSSDSGGNTLTSSESRKQQDRDEMSSPSSDDLDYADASSTGGGGSSPTASAVVKMCSLKSPMKKTNNNNLQPTIRKRKPKTYRSVISDIFDGKLVSTVQCLTCNRVSLTQEAFQDLSLPIPTHESLSSLRSQGQEVNGGSGGPGWVSWAWSWFSGFFYGPNITLNDCLSYFFSADELKGDNMYSCEKCKWRSNSKTPPTMLLTTDHLWFLNHLCNMSFHLCPIGTSKTLYLKYNTLYNTDSKNLEKKVPNLVTRYLLN